MLDKILACKPDSIFDIVPRQMFATDEATNYLASGNCFEWSYAVAKAIQPTSYLEIGVRYAYSFLPTLLGAPSLTRAVGMDLETYGDINVAKSNITTHYNGNCAWEILHVDSQQLQTLPEWYDLINIDGCHDYECKLHDLRLTLGKCQWVIIDDYDYLVDVRKAVNLFLQENGSDGWGKPSRIAWWSYLPTFRGSILIKYNV